LEKWGGSEKRFKRIRGGPWGEGVSVKKTNVFCKAEKKERETFERSMKIGEGIKVE